MKNTLYQLTTMVLGCVNTDKNHAGEYTKSTANNAHFVTQNGLAKPAT